jgi:hypothetical protein
MDKNFTIKKKDVFLKSKEDDKFFSVKIEVSSNHIMEKHIIELIENQLFDKDYHFAEYKPKKDDVKKK